ncbi:hypothetical protein HG530_003765 [Fusarium avenaceum]|nr:hypothetical protein HG530_003765 [Fusarium avenaceum]
MIMLLKVVNGFQVSILEAAFDLESTNSDKSILHDPDVGDDRVREEHSDHEDDNDEEGLVRHDGEETKNESDEVEHKGFQWCEDSAVDHAHVRYETVLELACWCDIMVSKGCLADSVDGDSEECLGSANTDGGKEDLGRGICHDLSNR